MNRELIDKILELTIVVIGLLVLTLVFLTYLSPSRFAQQAVPALTENPVTIVYEDIPCMINCMTKLEGTELSVLSSKTFFDIDNSPSLVEWFPCNNKILTLAMFVNEMARWDTLDTENISNSKRHKTPSTTNFHKEVEDLLYNCITAPDLTKKCSEPTMNFLNFCSADSYLTGYNFLPCSSINTFKEFLDKKSFAYQTRSGKDIDNDFVCDKSIGTAYNPGYSLCAEDDESKYDPQDCVPAWLTINKQILQADGTRELSYGRCEDFALVYYSLFRSINVPPENMSFSLGACNLPCGCSRLLKAQENLTSQMTSCAEPATLNINTYTSIDACSGIQRGPDSYKGEYALSAERDGFIYAWTIHQTFSGDGGAPYTRVLTLDNNYANDVRTFNFIEGAISEGNLLNTSAMITSKTNARVPINVIGNFSNISRLSLDLFNGESAKFQLNIRIDSLTDCNITVGGPQEFDFSLGFQNSPTRDYNLENAEAFMNLRYEGEINGYPIYSLKNPGNPNCRITYSVFSPEIIIPDRSRVLTSSNILTLTTTSAINAVVPKPVTGTFNEKTLEFFKGNYSARYGFEVNITGLSGCSNNTINLDVGFQGSESSASQYTLENKEVRGVMYHGLITGLPFYTFSDRNPSCTFNYTIKNAGLIIDDACYQYPITNMYTDAASCESFVVRSTCYNKTNPYDASSLSITDFISGQTCPV